MKTIDFKFENAYAVYNIQDGNIAAIVIGNANALDIAKDWNDLIEEELFNVKKIDIKRQSPFTAPCPSKLSFIFD